MSEAPDPEQGPYASAAGLYWNAGWRGVLPLPPHQKADPPKGYTGRDGAWPSYPDVFAWSEERPLANICLRLPPNVIGVDVDHYHDKRGGDTLAELETNLGELPATWRVTSRDDGISGIRLYRIPEGLRWPGVFGPSIESIRMEHRYAVVWPSIHPEGGTYRWIDPVGVTTIGVVPEVESLPELPREWVAAFSLGAATDQPMMHLGSAGVDTWLRERGAVDVPCKRMQRATLDAQSAIVSGLSRHDAALAATNRIVWLMGEGHTGGVAALSAVCRTFVQAVGNDRPLDALQAEWSRMVDGAVGMAAAQFRQSSTDPCLDPFASVRHLLGAAQPWTPPTTPTSTPTSTGSPTPSTASQPTSNDSKNFADGLIPPQSPTSPEASLTPTTAAIASEFDPYAEVRTRFRPGGSFVLDIPDHVPAIWGKGDDVLWAEGEALTIAGSPGVGKTTLTGQVVRGLIVGGDVLGLPVQRIEGRVLYLAMDRPRQIARALRRTLGDIPRAVLDEHLVVWPGPPIGDVAAHPEILLGIVQLADAQAVILDSLKDAAVGLTNDEVGAGYNRARQMVIADGRQVLELHHMVKRGDQGKPPNTLADLYGSVWIGAGAGSVIVLHGVAGETIVQFKHLKTPAEEVGPFQVMHDHEHGITTIFHGADLIALARLAGPGGITPKAAACSIEETDKPTQSQVEKARRRLDKLVRSGNLSRREGARGGGDDRTPTTYFWLADDAVSAQTAGLIPVDNPVDNSGQSNHETNHAPTSDETNHEPITAPTLPLDPCSETNHDTNHGNHAPSNHVRPPSFRRGGPTSREPQRRLKRQTIGGVDGYLDLDTGEHFSLDDPRLGEDPDRRRDV